LSEPAPFAVGVDVGGTKIAAGLVDLRTGAIVSRSVEPTHAERGGAAVLETVLQAAHHHLRLAAVAQHEVCGVGVGVCELVDPHGMVTSSATVAWGGLPVGERLAELGRVRIEADVRAHALAEARYGAGRGFRQCVFVTVGTGISSCLLIDGRPFAGARGNALVLASAPVSFVCEACGSLQRPVLEEIASGPALAARYARAVGATTALAEDVLAAAHHGNALAAEVVRAAGAALGVGIGWVVNVLHPEAFFVGGGLGAAGGL
jgi:glucokinase